MTGCADCFGSLIAHGNSTSAKPFAPGLDNLLGAPFYIDIGFSLAEIATVSKLFGFVVTIVGAVLGGVAVARYGLGGPLVFGAVLLAATNLCFAALAAYGNAVWFLFITIGADNLAAGFTGTVFIANSYKQKPYSVPGNSPIRQWPY